MRFPGVAGRENAPTWAKPLLYERKVESGLKILYRGMFPTQQELVWNWGCDGERCPIPKIVLSMYQSLILQLLKLAESGGLPSRHGLSGASYIRKLGSGFQRRNRRYTLEGS